MTTRAGTIGLLTGLLITILIYPFLIVCPEAYLYGTPDSISSVWISASLVAVLVMGGGFFASRWCGATQRGRCAVLGGLAGGLAGILVFCLWGAATAGLARWGLPLNESIPQVELIAVIIRQTMQMFLVLFLGGMILGMFGGWLAGLRQSGRADVFDKETPQMAMNASITAVPASIIAAALAAFLFLRLSDSLGVQATQPAVVRSIVQIPLAVSLLLVLLSHFALTMVVPHETVQSEHRTGMNEVKMAAYVGIGAAPLLILLLFLIHPGFFSYPLVVIALLASTAMSLTSIYSLVRLVLPKRNALPAPQEDRQKTEAKLFGTIAVSRGTRLTILCIGCGLAMVLPLYISVLSISINLASLSASTVSSPHVSQITWGLYLNQALVSVGVSAITILVLTGIYLFYLNLGRWFRQWNTRHPG